MDIQNVIEALRKYFSSIEIIENTDNMISFICENTSQLSKVVQIAHKADWQVTEEETGIYQLIGVDFEKIVKEIENKFQEFENTGIPDLSLVTLKQISNELKDRPGLIFALSWAEEPEFTNIHLEGSGEPNALVGLMTRSLSMAVRWADKTIEGEQE